VLDDEAEDQLALAARVTGVDQAGDVLALDEAGEQLEPVFGLLDGVEREMRRNHRQVRKRPLAALDLELGRHGELEQMPDRRREHVVLRLEVIFFFGEATDGAGDVRRNRWFFRDDQLLAHARGATEDA